MRPTICVLALSLTGILGLLAANTASAQAAGGSSQPATAPASQAAPQVAAGPTDKAREVAKYLKDEARSFTMLVAYIPANAEDRKSGYDLYLSVPEFKRAQRPMSLAVVISAAQAGKIIDCLFEKGILNKAWDSTGKDVEVEAGPYYQITLSAGRKNWLIPLGWNMETIRQLDAIRTSMGDSAAGKSMDKLMEQLAQQRKIWENAPRPASSTPASSPATTSAPSGTSRLEELSRNVKTLVVELRYYGPLHKGFYSLMLHVPDMHWLRRGQFDIDAQITEKQAIKILDYLQDAKVLDSLNEYNGTNWKMPEGPTYVVMVRYGKDPSQILYHQIGWDDALIKFADGLRKVLDEDQARKQMDVLMRPLGSLLKADAAEDGKKTPVP